MAIEGVKEALRARFQGIEGGVSPASSTPSPQPVDSDPLIVRAEALVELALNGSQDEREFAIQRLRDISFLAQVLARLVPNDPRVVALSYIVNARDCREAAGQLVRDFLKGASLPRPFDALGKLLG